VSAPAVTPPTRPTLVSAAATRTEGALLLDDLLGFLTRFVAFPSDLDADAVALWVAHCHAVSVFPSTPRLAVLSPEPGSGKTRVLEVLELLVPAPLFTLNASANALFRLVTASEVLPTLLLDEADTVFGPRASKDHEDLRGFVNGGHRRGALAYRCVVRGKNIEVESFESFAPVALAGLDDLPDTIMTRSVVVRMRRRAPGERVEPFRRRVHEGDGAQLRNRLSEWVSSSAGDLIDQWPDLPDGVEDRAADVWEPLVTIADAAGQDWPGRARASAVAFVRAAQESPLSLNVKLLEDLRTVFAVAGDPVHVGTAELLSALSDLDESPWGDLRGKPLDARGLSRRLAKYGIKPVNLRTAAGVAKGYRREDLWDAWTRYCPPTRDVAATSATSATDVARVADVADTALWEGDEDREPRCAVCDLPLAAELADLGAHPSCGTAS
jgi:hypothetical protein